MAADKVRFQQQSAAGFPLPNPGLKKFDRLIGTWEISGHGLSVEEAISGKVSFKWAEGGFFIHQLIEINLMGQPICGIEIIGFERRAGSEKCADNCTSHFFDNFGNHFEYVWEAYQNKLIIWAGYVGSSAVFKGQFNETNDILTGEWKWPGGGYSSKMQKIK